MFEEITSSAWPVEAAALVPNFGDIGKAAAGLKLTRRALQDPVSSHGPDAKDFAFPSAIGNDAMIRAPDPLGIIG